MPLDRQTIFVRGEEAVFDNGSLMFPGPLRAFHQAAQAGSIRKASEQLGLEPSSVSRQIAQLEALMGTKLFERSPGGVVLTHAGRLIAEYAQTTVNGFDTLRLDLNDMRGSRGLIRVAMVESVISAGPIHAASQFRETFENVSFEFEVLPATAVIESVTTKRADIGISFCTQPNEELIHDAVVLEPIVLVLNREHAYAGAKSLTLLDLGGLDLALPDNNFQLRRIFDQVAYRLGLNVRPVLTSNSFDVLRNFSRSGGGATILPSRAVAGDMQSGHLVAIPLDHPEFKITTLDLIRLKHWKMSRVVRLYFQKLRETLEADHFPTIS